MAQILITKINMVKTMAIAKRIKMVDMMANPKTLDIPRTPTMVPLLRTILIHKIRDAVCPIQQAVVCVTMQMGKGRGFVHGSP